MTGHVESEVYDAHEAFEIDKTKMKMLTPLDMNNQKIRNVNYDLKFGDLFSKIIKCYVPPPLQTHYGILTRKSDNQHVSFSNPVVLHAIITKKTVSNINQYIDIITEGVGSHHKRISLNNYPHTTLEIFESGIRVFRYYGMGNKQFHVDIAVSYM